MDEWLAAVIAAGAGFGSGLIVACSNYLLQRRQSEDAHRGELRIALTGFLAAIDLIAFELGQEPRPGRLVRSVNRALALLPRLDYIVARSQELIFQSHLRPLVERFHIAYNRLLLVAPIDLMPALESIAELMREDELQSDDWQRRWAGARGQVQRAARLALGEPIGELGEVGLPGPKGEPLSPSRPT